MSLINVIKDIQAKWNSVSPSMPLHLQMAPEDAQINYAVMRFGTITPGEGDLSSKDYTAAVTFVAYASGDVQAVELVDAMLATFDRGDLNVCYSSLLESAEFNFEYTDTGAMWSAAASFSLRWEVRI